MKKLKVSQDLIDLFMPIGYIYTSMDPTSPKKLFGGEWTQIVDKFIYLTNSSKKTGGTKKHKHGSGTLEARIGSAYGDASSYGFQASNLNATPVPTYVVNGSLRGDSRANSHNTATIGSTAETEVLPPYITAYAWYRTK